MATYTKAALIKEIAASTGVRQKDARAMLDKLCEITYREARELGGMSIPGICRIDTIEKKERKMRNPYTQEEIIISPHKAARVRLIKKAKDTISPPEERTITVLDESGRPSDATTSVPDESTPPAAPPREIIYDDFSSAVSFRCKECGGEIEAPAAAVGLSSECPVCGKVVKIPSESEPGTIHGPKIEEPKLEDMVEKVAQEAVASIAQATQKNQTIRIDLSTLTLDTAEAKKRSRPRSVSFLCKGCRQELEAPAEMMGMMSECPQCGAGFEVPFFSESGTLHATDFDKPSKKGENLSGRTIRIEMPDF